MVQSHKVENSEPARRDTDLSGSGVFLSVYEFLIMCNTKISEFPDEIINCLL